MALGLPARTVGGELDLDVLIAASGTPVTAETLSTFPVARTDVALTVPEDVTAEELAATLRSAAGSELEGLALFDVFRGEQVGEGLKSMAYRLSFRAPDRTLKTEEVSAFRDAAVKAAASKHQAVQR